MDASLFLTEVDIHHPKPLLDENLRAYIVQHSLFFEKCVVGDSQFNNNPNFRNLMWEKEANTQPATHPRDLWELAEKGFLVPAIRNEYGSLTALRKDHANRNVEHLPLEAYSTMMDEKLGNKIETYNIKDVSVAFRERVLEALDSEDNVGRGKISQKIALLVKDYVLKQDPLLFDSFRKWMQVQIGAGSMNERDYYLVDRLTAGAYRHNVAIALNKNLDIPISKKRDIFPISITMGNLEKEQGDKKIQTIHIRPSVVLSQKILGQIPASVLVEIKKRNPHYSRIVMAMENFRSTNAMDLEKFAGDLERYLADLEITFNQILTQRQKSDFLELKKKAKRKALLKLFIDLGATLAQPVSWLKVGLDVYDVVNTFYGDISEIRAANNQTEMLDGYILGRSNSMQKLYEITK